MRYIGVFVLLYLLAGSILAVAASPIKPLPEKSLPGTGIYFSSNPDLDGFPGKEYYYDADAVDPYNGAVMYTALSLPTGATLDQTTGEIRFTPQYLPMADPQFSIKAYLVSDPSITATQTWTVAFRKNICSVFTGKVTDAQGNPIANGTVTAIKFDGTGYNGDRYTVHLHADGGYEIWTDGPGKYILLADAPTFVSEYYDDVFRVQDATEFTHVCGDSDRALFSLDVLTSYTVQGRAYDAATNAAVTGAVEIYQIGKPPVSVSTDANGNYSADINRGNGYYIRITPDNSQKYVLQYHPSAFTEAGATAVNVNSNLTGIDIALTDQSSATVAIKGRVYDAATNAPVAAAVDIYRNGQPPFTGSTNANGEYNIAVTRDTGYYVRATPADQQRYSTQYHPNAFTQATATKIDASNNRTGIDIEMTEKTAATAIVRGRVYDGASNAAVQATVAIYQSGQSPITGSTDANGYYIISVPKGNSYIVRATPADMQLYQVQYHPAALTEQTATLINATSDISGIDVTMTKKAPVTVSISGRVYEKTTNASISASIAIYRSGQPPYSTTTNANGEYSLSVPAGNGYYVRATPADMQKYRVHYHPDALDEAAATQINATADLTGIGIEMTPRTIPTWTVQGRIYDNVSNAAVQATVYIEQSGQTGFSGRTDTAGNYSIAVTEGNQYFVRAVPDDDVNYTHQYHPNTYNEATATPVDVTQDLTGIDIAMTKLSIATQTVSGRIYDAATNLPVLGIVAAYQQGQQQYTDTTDRSGYYTITVPRGLSYIVKVTPADPQAYSVQYHPDVFTEAAAVRVDLMTDKSGIDIALTRIPSTTATVSGRVYNAITNDPVHATVLIYRAGEPPFSGITNASGNYSIVVNKGSDYFVRVEPGSASEYFIQYYETGYTEGTAALLQADNDRTDIDIAMTPKDTHNKIRGVTEDETGAPMETIVTAYRIGINNGRAVVEAEYSNESKSANNEFLFENIPAGDYILKAQSGGSDIVPGYYKLGVVAVPAWSDGDRIPLTATDSATGLLFLVQEAAGIQGTSVLTGIVYGKTPASNGQYVPIPNTTVLLNDHQGKVSGVSVSNSLGMYMINQASNGSFTLTADHKDFLPYSRTIDLIFAQGSPLTEDIYLESNLVSAKPLPQSAADLQLRLYPQPAANTATVEFGIPLQSTTIAIYNSLGVLVKTVTMAEPGTTAAFIEISGLPAGQYYVNVRSGIRSATIPLLIER